MAIIARMEPTLGPNHTGLILFDSLNGYLHPKDLKKKKFLAERNILPNMMKLLKGARRAGLTTFYPSGAHAADGSDTVARLTDTDMNLNPIKTREKSIAPGIHKDSRESEVAPELKLGKNDVMVPKHRWNSFYHTDLELHLKMRDIDTIVIAGGSTDVGIAATVFAARDMDLGVVVVSDCCYSTRGNNNQFFMERVFPRMGRVMGVDEAVKLMLAGALHGARSLKNKSGGMQPAAGAKKAKR
jgi:nicotinamidase-related amidase